jgi:hypothetical protein
MEAKLTAFCRDLTCARLLNRDAQLRFNRAR